MAKTLFEAELDEVELHRTGLQAALTAVDKARAEACSTEVVRDLKAAHQRICEVITFLTPELSGCDVGGYAGQRPGMGHPNFLKKGGRAELVPLFPSCGKKSLSN